MADILLYHSARCPYARRVRLLLEQLEIPYEDVEIDLGEVPSDFHRVSPYGLVPAITHNGEHVYESNIINEYLDEVYHGGLMPVEPLARARARILMAYADDHWMPDQYALKKAVLQKASRDELRERQQDVLRRLRELETKFHGPGPFLMGPALSLADIAFAPTVTELPHYGMHVPDKLEKTKRWVEALSALPALQRVPSDAPVIHK